MMSRLSAISLCAALVTWLAPAAKECFIIANLHLSTHLNFLCPVNTQPGGMYVSEPDINVTIPAERYRFVLLVANCSDEGAQRECYAQCVGGGESSPVFPFYGWVCSNPLPISGAQGWANCICSPNATATTGGECKDGAELLKCRQHCSANGKQIGQFSCWQDDQLPERASCMCVSGKDVVLPVQVCPVEYEKVKQTCNTPRHFTCVTQPLKSEFFNWECRDKLNKDPPPAPPAEAPQQPVQDSSSGNYVFDTLSRVVLPGLMAMLGIL
ncbi:hypothetical protein BC832DRAFT_58210 [Gaertneriomyces semiglobifer]|nr:hypothetical protein BC832DRAFT_58210 [Gaertneriomyces semiglobifer]